MSVGTTLDVFAVETSGTSMAPLVRHRSLAVLQRVQPEEIIPGDVVAFEQRSRTVLHRVVAVRGRGDQIELREKGDNAPFASWIRADQCLGRALWVSTQGSSRRLEGAASTRRVRLLTRLSRLEGDLFERLRALQARLPPADSPRPGRALLALLRGVLLPAKLPLLPILLSAYSAPDENEDARNRLLVAALRRAGAVRTHGGLDLPSDSSPAWATLPWEALSHGIVPQARALLSDRGGDRPLPPEIAGLLERFYHRQVLGHLKGVRTLREIHASLSASEIPYALLKGPLLSATYYPESDPRSSFDLDVLVQPHNLDRAVAALQGVSYQLASGPSVERLLRWGHFHTLLRPQRKGLLPVELHWSLVDRVNLFRISTDELFERIAKADAGNGVTAYALSREDELLYLCLHAAKHGLLNSAGLGAARSPEWFCRSITGNRLIWFLDIHYLLAQRSQELDWAELRRRATAWNIEEDVNNTLRVVDRLLPGGPAERALAAMGFEAPARDASPPSSATRGALLERSLTMDRTLLFRPARFLFLGRSLLPGTQRLMRYYGIRNPQTASLLRILHPFVFVLRLLRSSASPRSSVQRR